MIPSFSKELSPDALAKLALEAFLKQRVIIDVPTDLPDFLRVRAGCFVSIKTSQGSLRGCIGTIQPSSENVAAEIIRNVIKAATEDYRFNPVEEDELENLVYSVDILSPLEPIENLENHNVEVYGLMIETDQGRRGVLLPALPGIDTPEIQLKALKNKIGIFPDTAVKMSRFSVDRYGQK
ncbi:MAG: AmmeMemoRadiSam system protein A [Acidobacteria bacterium]|nr:AmmeMemoRadiSam system protein A [Acidobacteriota bacterium]